MIPIGIFGFGGGIGLFLSLFVVFLVVTYLALIYWTYLDARRRIEDPVLIACSVAASLFPFFGTVVYTILRPPEFIEDRQERDLELRASELRLRELVEGSCPHCEYPVGRDFLSCPNCERKLRSPCRKCRKPLDPRWKVCPYCETAVARRREERSPRRVSAQAARESRPAGAGAGSPVRDQRDSDQRDRDRRARAAAARGGEGASASRSSSKSAGGQSGSSQQQSSSRVPRGRPAGRSAGRQPGAPGQKSPRGSGS